MVGAAIARFASALAFFLVNLGLKRETAQFMVSVHEVRKKEAFHASQQHVGGVFVLGVLNDV